MKERIRLGTQGSSLALRTIRFKNNFMPSARRKSPGATKKPNNWGLRPTPPKGCLTWSLATTSSSPTTRVRPLPSLPSIWRPTRHPLPAPSTHAGSFLLKRSPPSFPLLPHRREVASLPGPSGSLTSPLSSPLHFHSSEFRRDAASAAKNWASCYANLRDLLKLVMAPLESERSQVRPLPRSIVLFGRRTLSPLRLSPSDYLHSGIEWLHLGYYCTDVGAVAKSTLGSNHSTAVHKFRYGQQQSTHRF